MFKFLKEKLKNAVKNFSKKVESLPEEEHVEEIEIKETKKGFVEKLKTKLKTTKIDEQQFEELFWDIELALLENNVAAPVVEKLKQDLKQKLVGLPIEKRKVHETIKSSVKEAIEHLFKHIQKLDLLKEVKKKKPFIILFLGVNGSGKTTTIAKIAYLFKKNNLSCVLAAADTWRAASIEQLEEHAKNLNLKVIKHQYQADPAAVAYDAIQHAKAKHIDVVLIDTAGRQHTNINLMEEMKKIAKVTKPDLKIFVAESIAGSDVVEQAIEFDNAIGIDAVILAKADVDEKGGAALSISYVTKKPIIFLGMGQDYKDLKEFDKEEFIKSLGL